MENHSEEKVPYTNSLKRYLVRQSLLSSLRPLQLFVKFDPTLAEKVSPNWIGAFTKLCLEHDIDGFVISQSNSDF